MMLNNLRVIVGYSTANNAAVTNIRNVVGENVNGTTNLRFTTLFSAPNYVKPVIGNGTDPVTASDYKLANEITDGILISNLATYNYRGEDQSSVICRVSGVIENVSSNPMVIKEIGLLFTAGVTNTSTHVLLMRETVDTYTLEPGECVQLTFSII